MTVLGADVSSLVDWAALKAAGVMFGSARCTTEPGTIDPSYAANVARMRAAGVLPGAYAFLVGRNAFGTPADQATAFMAAVGDPAGMSIQLDIEMPEFPAVHPPPTLADAAAWANTWSAVHPSHPVLIYLPPWYWSRMKMSGNAAALGPLWLSHYIDPQPGGTPKTIFETVPDTYWDVDYGGWRQATVLQFTGTYNVAGASVDLDAVADLAALTKGAQQEMPIIVGQDRVIADVAANSPYYDVPNGNKIGTTAAGPVEWLGSPTLADGVTRDPAWALIVSLEADGVTRNLPSGSGVCRYVERTALSNVRPLALVPSADVTSAVATAVAPLKASITAKNQAFGEIAQAATQGMQA